MPTRILKERAAARGVSLEQLAEVLRPVARAHFGPRLSIEVSVDTERQRVELAAVSRVTERGEGPSELSLAKAQAHFPSDVQLDDELMSQVFFTPDDELEMDAQDDQYGVVFGVSCVCSGFWPVARRALAPLLALDDDPLEPVLQRALLFTVATSAQRGEDFVLRRGKGDALFLKERVIVGDGEIAAGHFGRRDVLDGVSVEVIRREVPVIEVISGLFGSDAIERACEGTHVTKEQLVAALDAREVHVARRTAFRTRLERLVAGEKRAALEQFARLVASERDARFIP